VPNDFRERNEALFREVNEQIEGVSKTVPPDEQLMEFLCECDNRDCAEKISATRAEYEAVRAIATHFIVLPGHEDPDVEHIALQNERFLVVEKEGRAAQAAEKGDPRKT
jgi:metal-responsive CopG/Arc/MetJ family transcriptional regulator